MKRKELLNKLNSIAEPSKTWLEDAQNRIENRKTLEYSQEIALRILRELRKLNKSQTDLALALGVSKQQVNRWVKGRENFTIDTIAKIDAVLGLHLLNINSGDENVIPMNWVVIKDKAVDVRENKERNNYSQNIALDTISLKSNDFQTASTNNLAS